MKNTKFFLPVVILLLSFLYSCSINSDNPTSNVSSISDGPLGGYNLTLKVTQSAPNNQYDEFIKTFHTNNWSDIGPLESITTNSWQNSVFSATITFSWSADTSYNHAGHFIIYSAGFEHNLYCCGPTLYGSATQTFNNISLTPGTTYNTQLSTVVITGSGDE